MGVVLVIIGSLALGLRIAFNMRGRIRDLKEIERILGFLEGELRVRHSTMDEALENVASKSGQPFKLWLKELAENIRTSQNYVDYNCSNEHIDLHDMWNKSLDKLLGRTSLNFKDIEQLQDVGRALGYLDIESQQMNLKMEMELIHQHILTLDKDLSVRMKNAVVVCLLGGIMTVIALL